MDILKLFDLDELVRKKTFSPCQILFHFRYSDKHNCTFDYKALGKSEIAEANPVIAPKKIDKI